MHSRHLLIVLAMAPLVARTDLLSQVPDWVRVGSRLRVTTQGQPDRLVGALLEHGADSIRLRVGARPDSVTIAVQNIVALELSRERGNRAVTGAVVGALALGLLGGYLMASDPDVGDKGAGAVVGFGLLGPLGAVLGGAIGSSIQTDVWVALPTTRGSGDPGGAPGLRVLVQFRHQP